MRAARILGAVAPAIACVSLVPSQVDAAGSPQQTVSAILAAGNAQRSVHYVVVATAGATVTHLVGDVATTSGTQRITFEKGALGGQVTVIVVAHTAYVRGDAFVLQSYMGFKPAAAEKFAEQWIRVPRTDRAYGAISAAVTLPSVIDEIRIAAPLSRVFSTIIGNQHVVGVTGTSGKTAVHASLFGRATGSPLPVAEVESAGTASANTMFSRWNERVHVVVPTRPVDIAVTRLG